MSSVAALCHACNETFLLPTMETNNLYCRLCGSDFVEILSEQDARPRNPRRSPFQSRFGDPAPQMMFLQDGNAVSIRLAHGGADDFVRELTHVFDMEPNAHSHRFGSLRRNFGSEMERLVSQLAQYHQPTRTPASVDAVNGLRREKLRNGRGENRIGECCVVCHDCYKEGDRVMYLPCSHIFHEDCVMPWFEEHNTCPVCRHALPVETSPAPHRHVPQRLRRNQVAQDNHTRDANAGDQIDSLFGLFRAATGGEAVPRNTRLRATPENAREDEEYHLRESIRSAQNQLNSLENRLTEHIAEHEHLQHQIMQLHDHGNTLRRGPSFRSSAIPRVYYDSEMTDDRRSSTPLWRTVFGALRNSSNGRNSDFGNPSEFSEPGPGR